MIARAAGTAARRGASRSAADRSASSLVAHPGAGLLPARGLPHDLQRTHAPFAGFVQTSNGLTRIHELDWRGVPQGWFLEVSSQDVGLREALPTIVTERGESVARARVWVRKGSRVIKVATFTAT